MEWLVMSLLFAECSLHFLDIGVEVGVVVREWLSRMLKKAVHDP